MAICTSIGVSAAIFTATALLVLGIVRKVQAAGLHGAAANAMNAQATSLFKYTAVAGAVGVAAVPIGLVVDCLWMAPAACCYAATGALVEG